MEVDQQQEEIAIAQAIHRATQWYTYAISNIDAIPASKKVSTPMSPDRNNKYICRRCGNPGHLIKYCPTNGDPAYNKVVTHRSVAGIPRTFLTSQHSGDQKTSTFKLTSGENCYLLPKTEIFQQRIATSFHPGQKNKPPAHLTCQMCKRLFEDPVKMPCCQTSFCCGCLIDDPLELVISCPLCHRTHEAKHLISDPSL